MLLSWAILRSVGSPDSNSGAAATRTRRSSAAWWAGWPIGTCFATLRPAAATSAEQVPDRLCSNCTRRFWLPRIENEKRILRSSFSTWAMTRPAAPGVRCTWAHRSVKSSRHSPRACSRAARRARSVPVEARARAIRRAMSAASTSVRFSNRLSLRTRCAVACSVPTKGIATRHCRMTCRADSGCRCRSMSWMARSREASSAAVTRPSR